MKLSEKKMLIMFALYQYAAPTAIALAMAMVCAWALLSGISNQVGNAIAVTNF